MTSVPPSPYHRFNNWIRDSVTVKLLSAGFIALLLLIPASMVRQLVQDRSGTHGEAIAEISDSWGRAQIVSGPAIVVPFRNEDSISYAYFLPESLDVIGSLETETLYRGIYEAAVYTSRLEISGRFAAPDFSDWSMDDADILWEEAAVAVGITDMRGIQNQVTLEWGDISTIFGPGIQEDAVMGAGMSAQVPIDSARAFRFSLDLKGSRSLFFVPVGKETHVSLMSPWSDPSFDGAFLPVSREVTDDGFEADWMVLDLNRPFPQAWRGRSADLRGSAFGVRLLMPVDHYRKTLRASTYAILVIGLTLLSIFLLEVLLQRRAHPFQYILVGLGLCMFYGLLLALSEHLSFNLSYAMAAVATTTTIAAYLRTVFQAKSYGVGGVLLTAYAFMFVLLQLEEMALLVGMIGLFVILAATMYLTRNIQWFADS